MRIFANFLCQPHGFRASVDQLDCEDPVNGGAVATKGIWKNVPYGHTG